MAETVNILGADYKITVKKYDEDEHFRRNGAGGYCAGVDNEIVLCDMQTFPGWEVATKEECKRQQQILLRHEIVHAFLYESGLGSNSARAQEWATNEEMVDWIALQGQKIYKAWGQAGAL